MELIEPTGDADAATVPGDRLVSFLFVRLVVAALAYFTSMTMLLPVIPRYVEDELSGNGFEVGLAVGAFAVSAALVRTYAGRLGDRYGRRPLAVGGALIAAVTTALYGVIPSLAVLVGLRLLTGLGEAGFFVGAATAAQDLSPDERRGEAASFFSISIYGGLAFGPYVGEWLYREHGAEVVWPVAAALAGIGAVVALTIPRELGRVDPAEISPPGTGWGRFLHPAAVLPGSILLLGLFGFAGFTAFLPLHVDDLGIDDAGPFFLVYGLTVLAVRILGAKIPDRFGALRTTTVSLSCIAVAVAVIGTVESSGGIYAGTVVLSIGMALLFPALFSLAVNAAPASERSHAVGTFSLFFDLSQGFGAPVLGLMVTIAGTETAAFYGGAVIAVVGLGMARARLEPMRPRVSV